MRIDLRRLWSKRLLAALSTAVCCAGAVAGGSGFHRLSEKGIRAALVGKTVTDDAHWADRFLPDGVLDSHDLGEPRRGAWAIERGELCITRKARHPVKECFELWIKGDEVEYRRDGVATVTGFLRD